MFSESDAAGTNFRATSDPHSLSKRERVRFEVIILQTLRLTETISLEYKEGMLLEAQRYGTQIAWNTPGALLFWKHLRNMLTRSFV